jgi:ribokinase
MLTQLEIPLELTLEALKLAKKYHIPTILNPGIQNTFLNNYQLTQTTLIFLSYSFISLLSLFFFSFSNIYTLIHSLTHSLPRPGFMFFFSPAPAQVLPDEIFTYTDILCPNETELELLSQKSITNVKEAEIAAKLLLQR